MSGSDRACCTLGEFLVLQAIEAAKRSSFHTCLIVTLTVGIAPLRSAQEATENLEGWPTSNKHLWYNLTTFRPSTPTHSL